MTVHELVKTHVDLATLTDLELVDLLDEAIRGVQSGRQEAQTRLDWLRHLMEETERRGAVDAERDGAEVAVTNLSARAGVLRVIAADPQ